MKTSFYFRHRKGFQLPLRSNANPVQNIIQNERLTISYCIILSNVLIIIRVED